MNKSILKHEARWMKWILLLSILASLFLTIMFSLSLDTAFERIFSHGLQINQVIIQDSLRYITGMILVIFTIISIIQVFMQFRSEKDQEVGRFLKSLPVKKEEFFKVKLSTGIINITLGFIVLAMGIIIVRTKNMFWIKDIYSISTISAPFVKADGIGSLLKEIGLIYLIVLSFYTFLFMVQYTFTNVIGGIVTGILVWLAPGFIIYVSMFTLERFSYEPIFHTIARFSEKLLPWLYPFEYNYNTLITDANGMALSRLMNIENLEIKYIITLGLILINIIIGDKLNKSSKVENENMIIPFKISRNIFKFGVTICSGLLVSIILSEIMMIQINNIIYMLLILLGGFIGYFISQKIARVGIR
jgi:hypothetical protein